MSEKPAEDQRLRDLVGANWRSMNRALLLHGWSEQASECFIRDLSLYIDARIQLERARQLKVNNG